MNHCAPLNILAIGPHPDDIEIGCGGTMAKYAANGHHVYFFVASDGAAGGDPAIRRAEQEHSCRLINAAGLFWGDLTDTQIQIEKITIQKIEQIIQLTKPDLIFVNHHDDTHQDHRHIAALTYSATRYIRNVLMYETPTTSNFNPSVFVDIGESFLKVKIETLQAHASQINRTNIANLSIIDVARSAALFRGVQARVTHAEAFQSLRLFLTI